MIKSMTGFGRGKFLKRGIGSVVVEIQSVNRKHIEYSLNLSKEMVSLECKIRDYLSKKIERGRINVFVEFTSDGAKKVKFNEKLAEEYLKQYKRLKVKLKLKGEIDFSHIAKIPDLFSLEEENIAEKNLWFVIEKALGKALANLLVMRKQEGRHIEQDIKIRIRFLEKIIAVLTKQAPITAKRYEEKVLKKFSERKELINNKELLAKEVASFAEKIDISEEICRINSHLKQFADMLKQPYAVGRSLDFLVQELIREINTIASKSSDEIISKKVIFFKSELEKIREQIQNIE